MKLLFFILFLSFCYACKGKDEGFVVRGEIEGYEGTKLYVREMTPDNTAWMNDTLDVVDGKFCYRGKLQSPCLVYFVPENFRGRYELFLDNSDVELKVSANDFGKMEVKGCRVHDEYMQIKQKSSNMLNAYNQYRSRKSKALKNNQSLYQELEDSTRIWAKCLLDFLCAQPNYEQSMVLPYFANEWLGGEALQELEIYLSDLDSVAFSSLYAQYDNCIIQQAKSVLPGRDAFDFQLQDTLGKTYQLSDYRGKYVLLEFSASWCGWCKLEIPFLKRVYELSAGKNFVMFTINMDTERSLWINEVLKENLPWTVLSDLQGFEGEVARHYNVTGIPVIFLIDPEGKIVTNQLRGEKMIEYIKKFLL